MSNDPDTLVVLTTARTEFEAETLAEALRSRGVRAEVFAAAASALQWEAGYTDPIKVMVRRGDAERAEQVRVSLKADSVDIDWDEVDTGDAAPAIAGRIADERARRATFDEPRRPSMLKKVWAVGWIALSLVLAWMAFNLAASVTWGLVGQARPAVAAGTVVAIALLLALWKLTRKDEA